MRRDWTPREEAALVTLAYLGVHDVCLILDRSPASVKPKASRLGVSLKRKSQIHATTLQPSVLEQIKKRRPSMICPACGKRLVATKDGLCGACHLEALTDAHNAEYAKLAAKKPYDVSKQRLRRLRKQMGVRAPRARGGDAEA